LARSSKLRPCPFLALVFSIHPDGIVLKPGYEWSQIYCAPQTMGLQVDEELSENGKLFPVQVVGFIPGEDLEATEGLLQFDGVRVILRVITANGNTRIAGSPSSPLEIAAPFNSGIDPDTRAGRSLRIAGICLKEPLYVINPVL
jgi:hypothetical protein